MSPVASYIGTLVPSCCGCLRELMKQNVEACWRKYSTKGALRVITLLSSLSLLPVYVVDMRYLNPLAMTLTL